MSDPIEMKLWKHPSHYVGQTYYDYFVLIGRHRDSDDLTNANFDAALKLLGGETETMPVLHQYLHDNLDTDLNGNPPAVIIARASHWAVGWSEFIGIYALAFDKIEIGNNILQQLDNYPVLDESLYDEYQTKSAQLTWECLNYIERRNACMKYGGLSKREAGYAARRKYFSYDAWEYLTQD